MLRSSVMNSAGQSQRESGNFTLTAGKLSLSEDSPSDEKGEAEMGNNVVFRRKSSLFFIEIKFLYKQHSDLWLLNYPNFLTQTREKFYHLVDVNKKVVQLLWKSREFFIINDMVNEELHLLPLCRKSESLKGTQQDLSRRLWDDAVADADPSDLTERLAALGWKVDYHNHRFNFCFLPR